MKILIFSLLSLFLIGTFDGVCHGTTHEKKKTEVVKIAYIDYSLDANSDFEKVVVNSLVVAEVINYKIASIAKTLRSEKNLYNVFRPNRIESPTKKVKWLSYSDSCKNQKDKKENKFNSENFSLFNRPRLC